MSASPCGATNDVLITLELEKKRRKHEKCKINKGGLNATLVAGVEESMMRWMNEINTWSSTKDLMS